MRNLKAISYILGLIFICHQAQADESFNIVQVTQPEAQRIDLTLTSFFFLNPQEKLALRDICNKHTLYNYDWFLQGTEKNQHSVTRKMGDFEIIVDGHKPTQGSGGAAPTFEVTVQTKEKHKILDHIPFKIPEFESISFVKDGSSLLIISHPLQKPTQNYKIPQNLKSPIEKSNDLEDYIVK